MTKDEIDAMLIRVEKYKKISIENNRCLDCGGSLFDYFGFDCDSCLQTGKYSVFLKLEKMKAFK